MDMYGILAGMYHRNRSSDPYRQGAMLKRVLPHPR